MSQVQHPFIGAHDCQPRVCPSIIQSFEKPFRACQPSAHRCHQRSVGEVRRKAYQRLLRAATPADQRHRTDRGRPARLDRAHRDGRPASATSPSTARSAGASRPSPSASMRRSNACSQSRRATAECPRSTTPRAASSSIARLPNPRPWNTGYEQRRRNRESYRRNSLAHASVARGPSVPTNEADPEEGPMDIAKVNSVELDTEVIGSGEPVLLISPVLADGSSTAALRTGTRRSVPVDPVPQDEAR